MAVTRYSQIASASSTAGTIPAAGRYAAVSGGTTTSYSSGGVTYQVQTFTASGTLTVANSGLVDVLLVGGGAGAGPGTGGGGGGVVYQQNSMFVPAGSYTVTVGASGAGTNSLSVSASNGTVSSLFNLYANGGLAANAYNSSGGNWSGGGNAGILNFDTRYLGGSGVNSAGGGGAGFGGNGGNGSTNTGGNGGVGVASTITGSSVGYGGGGGSGVNPGTPGTATDGGGAGISGTTTGNSGAANRGGGGGSIGGASGAYGGSGGSGVVIVRTVTAGSAAGVSASGGTETTFTGNGTIGVNGRNYKVHKFTATGTFTVTGGGYIDACLVAGGGGAGAGLSSSYGGSGGGAGGMLEVSNFYIAPGTYTVTVGAAGANASSGSGVPGYAGGDSSISGNVTLTAVGGGFGDGVNRQSPSIGGSGGGSYGIAARGINGQGYAACNANYIYGGNGGGAGGAAVQGVGTAVGSYGVGRTTTISGASVEYSRGGAGGLQTKPGTGQKGNGGSSEYANNGAFEAAQGGEVVIRYAI